MEIEELIKRLRQPLGREETMLQWDHWRRLMKQTRSSLPRDAFEAWCELQDEEERTPAATALEALRAERDALKAEMDRRDKNENRNCINWGPCSRHDGRESVTGEFLIFLCVILVLLPPKYDPAIRIKEWQIKKGWHPESPAAGEEG